MDNGVSMPELISSRPLLAIDGQIDTDVSEDIISASFDDGINRLRVMLNNWDTGSYKYSDRALLRPGKRVELYVGPDAGNLRRLFDGKIAAIAPSFTSDKPSTVLIEAVGLPEKAEAQIKASLGKELHEFKPILSSGKTAIECSGTIMGIPGLRAGSTITISGVGQAFNGAYSVTKTVHSFDSQSGYKTHFVASTEKPQNHHKPNG
jgi:hypothetical protein